MSDTALIEANEYMINRSVGLYVLPPQHSAIDLLLIGSGTLASLGEHIYVITADHVLEALDLKLQDHGHSFGLLLDKTSHATHIQRNDYSIRRFGNWKQTGADIGAIELFGGAAGSIRAKKSFVNLGAEDSSLADECIWIVSGFVDEYSESNPKLKRAKFRHYHYRGATSDYEIIRDDIDRVIFTPDEIHEQPKSFGGVSGGGLWRIPIVAGKPDLRAKFSGVATAESEDPDPNSDGMRINCHGPLTVYSYCKTRLSTSI